MDKFDKKISELFKKEIKRSNSYEYTLKSTLNNIEVLSENIEIENFYDKKEKKYKLNLRYIVSLVACFVLSFGIINSNNFAEKIYLKTERDANKKIATATPAVSASFENNSISSNGEIKELQNDMILDQDSIKISIDEIIMDDNLLRVTFDMDFIEEISKNIKYNPDDFYYIDIKFEDLLITDEEENVLYSSNVNNAIDLLGIGGENRDYMLQSQLENELKKNEKYFCGNEDYFINKYNNGNAELIYNLNLVGLDRYYPRSKNLKFDIGKIRIITEEGTGGEEVYYYTGEWNLKIDIPENVYSRKRVSFKEISNNIGEENETLKFDVLKTCTEVKLSLKTIDRASLNPAPCATLLNSLEIGQPSTQIRDWFVDLFRASDEFKKYEEDLLKSYLITGNKFEDYNGDIKHGPYLENENGQKFDLCIGPYANGGGVFTEDNFYQPSFCFDLKQEYITEKLSLHFIYLDKEYIFEFEKESEV